MSRLKRLTLTYSALWDMINDARGSYAVAAEKGEHSWEGSAVCRAIAIACVGRYGGDEYRHAFQRVSAVLLDEYATPGVTSRVTLNLLETYGTRPVPKGAADGGEDVVSESPLRLLDRPERGGMLDKPAAKGAALLDEKIPGWAERIDLSTLEMSNSGRCILGQLGASFGTSYTGVCYDYLNVGGDMDAQVAHGFDVHHRDDWEDVEKPLLRAWAYEIQCRRIGQDRG